jgi:hypothetical protein
MPSRKNSTTSGTHVGGEKVSHAVLEARRESLLRRLESLPPKLRANRGYASARSLLGSNYIRASLTARLAVLRTAQFMITVLEMLPPT